MDPSPPATPDRSAARGAAAFGVHVFTALGGGLALLALLAATEAEWAVMFAWLGAALIVDGIDGTLARRLDVARVAPRWSGETLDLVVDILTYVFVPAYAMVAAGLFPDAAAVPLGLVIVITGVLYFADGNMKSADNYFMGFPAVWNLVAFYLFVLQPAPWLAAAIVVALAILTFLPVPFVHPFRVRRLWLLTAALLLVWAILAAAALVQDFDIGILTQTGLCIIALYFLGAGWLRGNAFDQASVKGRRRDG